MGFIQKIADIAEHLGQKNAPVYTVATVAVFKGIFRPIFTMMDKKQKPETKKYAAVKEGTTELIAIPTYIGLSMLTEKLAPAFTPKGKNFNTIIHNSKATLGFVGVCVAALYAIPQLCNVAMPYVMKALKLDKHKKEEHQITPFANETLFQNESVKNSSQFLSTPYSKTPINFNGGMRV